MAPLSMHQHRYYSSASSLFPFAPLSNCFTPLENRAVFSIEGKDAFKFLQDTICNDMRTVTLQKGISSGALNAKGRLLFDFLVFVNPHSPVTQQNPETKPDKPVSYLIECGRNQLDPVMKHFTKYKLRAQLTVTDFSQQIRVFQAMGPNSLTLGDSAASATGSDKKWAAWNDPRYSKIGSRVYFWASSPDDVPPLNAQFEPVPFSVYQSLRIMHGIPEGIEDMPSGESYPLESNFEYLNGVSLEKGCYLGQEFTARTYHLGQVRKRVMPVFLRPQSGNPPTAPSEALQGDPYLSRFQFPVSGQIVPPPSGTPLIMANEPKPKAHMCSSVHNIGLALIRVDEVFGTEGHNETPLQTLQVDGLEVVPVRPEWFRKPDPEPEPEEEEEEEEQPQSQDTKPNNQ